MRREFHEALLEADNFEDLPGKWQAAILKAGQSRPYLRVLSGDGGASLTVVRRRSPSHQSDSDPLGATQTHA